MSPETTTFPAPSTGSQSGTTVPADCGILADLGFRTGTQIFAGWQMVGGGDKVAVIYKILDRSSAASMGDKLETLASPVCSQVQIDGSRITVAPNQDVKPLVRQGRSFGIRAGTEESLAFDLSIWQGGNLVLATWTMPNQGSGPSPGALTMAAGMNLVLAKLGVS
jgi:hypothetical protein